jgi:hypothetical protein
MMKSPPTVSVLVARLLVQVAEARGAGVAPLLTNAGVDPELLKNPDARVSLEAMDALWEAIPRCVGDESFGLHVAEQSTAIGNLDLVAYREVVDAVRRELSLSYLREPRLRLIEISFLLGFAETSAFYRAFRRWTGTTPLEYRKHHAT